MLLEHVRGSKDVTCKDGEDGGTAEGPVGRLEKGNHRREASDMGTEQSGLAQSRRAKHSPGAD